MIISQCKQKSPNLESSSVQEGVKNADGFAGKLYTEMWSPFS